tara:strand:+ start:1654 stop:2850 length:1197 start_codon:yes stop_codon:yes gene_type:complete
MGGERGSTSGLRFNPRESAEEIQEDSSVGREDSEERALHDAKKQQEQEDRAKIIQGIQHLKIKIPQQNAEDEERPTEEAGELAGQVGQADAIEGANPHGNGLGMGVMTGEPMDVAFDSIKKKDEPKYDTDKPKKTTTIDTVRARQREKKGRKRRSGKTVTIESKKKTRKSKAGNPLRVDTGLNPGGYTGVMASHRASQPSVQYSSQTQTRPNYLSLFSGRSKPKTSYSDPRGREAESQRADMAATQPTQRITPSIPTVRADSRIVHAPRGSAEHRDATMGPKKTHTPRKPDTPMGEGHSKAHDLASGGASMFAPLLAKGQSGINRHEYRRIVQKLEKLLRDLTNKMDASLDPAPDGPTPNAGPRMTSAPTGATETDPDDDPTMWGAHAYGLYTRRGGL